MPMVGLDISKVLEIECKKEYEALIKSGMAWEFHPWLTGDWDIDKEQFINEISNKVNSIIEDVHTKN